MTTLYHCTDSSSAILRDGFRDGEGSYALVGQTLRGVWLSDVPVDCNEGAKGDDLLAVDVPDDLNLDAYEIVLEPEPMGYREWCIPAALINDSCSVRLMSEDEEYEALIAKHEKYPPR